jgi:hypothetical protein
MSRRRNRPGRGPSAERLEGRDLPSAITSLMAAAPRNGHGLSDGARNVQQGVAARQDLPPNPLLFPSGEPTPRQRARQTFVARFEGTFAVGPPRFTGETQQLFLRGAGGSNQFLHGDTQLRIITPADPTRPLGGVMVMFDRNINSNSTLGLHVSADRSSLDAAGRPLRLKIDQIDPNISGGAYVEGAAQGTIEIRYLPNRRRSPRAFSQGNAIITVRAQVYSIRTAFVLRNADIDPGGPSAGP